MASVLLKGFTGPLAVNDYAAVEFDLAELINL
jgi:hypothetical protein